MREAVVADDGFVRWNDVARGFADVVRGRFELLGFALDTFMTP